MENPENVFNNKNLENDLVHMNEDLGLIKRVPCSKEEEIEFRKLREEGKKVSNEKYGNVYESSTYFYRYQQAERDKEEIDRLIAYRQMKYLNTIKNCLIFFTVLACFSILVAFIFFLKAIY